MSELENARIIVDAQDLSTAQQVADYLGIHFTNVYRWANKGKLHVVPVAGQKLFWKPEVEALKKELEEKNEPD